MKDRILAFLKNENKSYAQFAEEIGVQPSGISHILSGRNNPSLDFVIKMLQKYTSLSAEWLLFGNGSMYKTISQPTLFDNAFTAAEIKKPEETTRKPEEDLTEILQHATEMSDRQDNTGVNTGFAEKHVTRVVLLYSDKTFTDYRPD